MALNAISFLVSLFMRNVCYLEHTLYISPDKGNLLAKL